MEQRNTLCALQAKFLHKGGWILDEMVLFGSKKAASFL